MRKQILGGILLILVVSLFGCGSGKNLIQVSLKRDKNINGGNNLQITYYQLKNDDSFVNYPDFSSLLKNPEVLKSDFIANTQIVKFLMPDDFKVNSFELKNEAGYLGVVSDCKDGLKKAIPLNSNFNELIIHFHEDSISYEMHK